jgi:hypothetical protein
MSEEDRGQDLTWDQVREQLDHEFPLLRRFRERSEAVTSAVADEMASRGLDTGLASLLAEKALEALEEFEARTGDEDREFALHVSGYPLGTQEAAVDLVDELMGILLERPRPLGVVGFTTGRNSPGLTFTVKAPDARGAIRVGLAEVEEALSRLGVSPDIAKVEAEPAEWFWEE